MDSEKTSVKAVFCSLSLPLSLSLTNDVVLFVSIAGVSRSTTIVAAYILTVTTLNWKDALKAIKCARSVANPNYGFQRQLQDFDNKLVGKVCI